MKFDLPPGPVTPSPRLQGQLRDQGSGRVRVALPHTGARRARHDARSGGGLEFKRDYTGGGPSRLPPACAEVHMSTPARVVAVLCIAVGAYLAGTWSNRALLSTLVRRNPAGSFCTTPARCTPSTTPTAPATARAAVCGWSRSTLGGETGLRARNTPLPPGGVEISPERQQIIGVKTEEVTKGPASHTVRVSGRVALDESRRVWVSTAVDGWVRSVAPITTGSIVQKDELLATFYNRDFLTAQQTYLYALATMDSFKIQGERRSTQAHRGPGARRGGEPGVSGHGRDPAPGNRAHPADSQKHRA